MSTYKRRTKLKLNTTRRKGRVHGTPTPVVLHIAVVISEGFCRNSGGNYMSKRPRGDWAAFINTDKNAVIVQAQNAGREWENQYGPYKILTGTLTNKVLTPVLWREEPLFE